MSSCSLSSVNVIIRSIMSCALSVIVLSPFVLSNGFYIFTDTNTTTKFDFEMCKFFYLYIIFKLEEIKNGNRYRQS